MIKLYMLQYGELITEDHASVKGAAQSGVRAFDSMYANPGRIQYANGRVAWENAGKNETFAGLRKIASE